MGRLGKIFAAIGGIALVLAILLMILLTFTNFAHGGPAWHDLDIYGKALFLFIILGMGMAAAALLWLSSKPPPAEPLRTLRPRK